jgi:PIN domain nuclease of toxin-antitoxin system
VNLLLDTHVWVWASQAPEELGKRARAALLAGRSALFVSSVSHLEVARLVRTFDARK